MRWTTAAAVFLFTIPQAMAGETGIGLSLACPWSEGYAECVTRWSSLVPASARTALARCHATDAAQDQCFRQELQHSGLRVLSPAEVEAERERQLSAWAADRSAKEAPAIQKFRETQDAKLAEQEARRAAELAAAQQSKAELDKLLVALQPEQ